MGHNACMGQGMGQGTVPCPTPCPSLSQKFHATIGEPMWTRGRPASSLFTLPFSLRRSPARPGGPGRSEKAPSKGEASLSPGVPPAPADRGRGESRPAFRDSAFQSHAAAGRAGRCTQKAPRCWRPGPGRGFRIALCRVRWNKEQPLSHTYSIFASKGMSKASRPSSADFRSSWRTHFLHSPGLPL